MEESAIYQALVREAIATGRALGRQQGILEGQRKFLRLVGQKFLGPPSPETTAAIEAIEEPAAIEQLTVRLPDVASWAELLAKPDRPRRRRKRTP